MTIVPTTLEINEGDSATYTVVLDTQPTGNVIITIHGPAISEIALSAATLTFKEANWHAAQEVRVTAGEDDDTSNDKVIITHTVSGYGTVTTAASVDVTVTDDTQVAVSFGSATYSATEGGNDAAVTVQLSTPAPRQVDIPLTPEAIGQTTPDDWSGVPDALTFNAGDTSQFFTVTAVDDTVEDDGEMLQLSFGTLPEGFAAGDPATAKITLMNDDMTQTDNQSSGDNGNCPGAVWCATLVLGYYNDAPDNTITPAIGGMWRPTFSTASLSDSDFTYEGVDFCIQRIVSLVTNHSRPHKSAFDIDFGCPSSSYPEGHLDGLLLYVDGAKFSFYS